MDLNDIRSAVTLFSFALFAALMAWTWRPSRRGAHDAAARLVFDDTDPQPAPEPTR